MTQINTGAAPVPAPVAAPAAPPVPVAAPPAVAPVAPPAAAVPPAAPTAPPAASQTPLEDVTMATPVEYTDADGSSVNTTLGDLIQRHAATRNVDPSQVATISGALNNDPAASRALIEQQLAKLTPVVPETPEGLRIAELENRLKAQESQATSTKRVTDAYESQEVAAGVRNLLGTNPEVQKALPWLASRPDAGIVEATRQILQLREASRASGQGGVVSGEVISRVLTGINQRIEQIATLYGGSISPNTQQQPGGAVVTAAAGVPGAPGQPVAIPASPGEHNGVRPPLLTAAAILAAANPPPINPYASGMVAPAAPAAPYPGMPAPPVAVPAVVPQPGGQIGGMPPSHAASQPANQPGQKFTADQMKLALTSRRAAEEGAVQ